MSLTVKCARSNCLHFNRVNSIQVPSSLRGANGATVLLEESEMQGDGRKKQKKKSNNKTSAQDATTPIVFESELNSNREHIADGM